MNIDVPSYIYYTNAIVLILLYFKALFLTHTYKRI
jgi:hypothetical protein